MDTAAEYEETRGAIESNYNEQRTARENQYAQEKADLEADYNADIAAIEQARVDAHIASGLNSDGTDPQGRPQG